MTCDFARYWSLAADVDYLNHASFGACPVAVQEAQQKMRAELERQPVDFLARRLFARFDAAREALAAFLAAEPEGLVAVDNATTGVNAVLRSLSLAAGDEIVVTDHAYNACRNAIEFVTERSGARIAVASIPFPVESSASIVGSILDRVTSRTRLVFVDHVTSPTALVLPVSEIVHALRAAGKDVLVDGAHAPGMLPLDLGELRPTYYVGNCHKWMCAPKGAGFLYVDATRRDVVRPTVISHGFNVRRTGRSRFHDEFDWTGTGDPTAFLCVPVAIELMASMVTGGWDEIRDRNHRLALQARDLLVATLGIEPPCPDEMIGAMASVPLPVAVDSPAADGDPLQIALREGGIEVPVMNPPHAPGRLLRVSAQLYNTVEQYERLAGMLQGSGSESPNPLYGRTL